MSYWEQARRFNTHHLLPSGIGTPALERLDWHRQGLASACHLVAGPWRTSWPEPAWAQRPPRQATAACQPAAPPMTESVSRAWVADLPLSQEQAHESASFRRWRTTCLLGERSMMKVKHGWLGWYRKAYADLSSFLDERKHPECYLAFWLKLAMGMVYATCAWFFYGAE
jgi:hypothetical protein